MSQSTAGAAVQRASRWTERECPIRSSSVVPAGSGGCDSAVYCQWRKGVRARGRCAAVEWQGSARKLCVATAQHSASGGHCMLSSMPQHSAGGWGFARAEGVRQWSGSAARGRCAAVRQWSGREAQAVLWCIVRLCNLECMFEWKRVEGRGQCPAAIDPVSTRDNQNVRGAGHHSLVTIRGMLGDQSSRMRVNRRGRQPQGAAMHAYEDGHRDGHAVCIE